MTLRPKVRLLLGAILGTTLGTVSAAEPAPLKVLMITGGCCHDYDAQKEILSVGLSARANLAFTIVHEGGESRAHKVSIYANPDWAKGFDVIVHNECFGAVEDIALVEAIAKAHFDGVPGVALHCAAHSYRTAKTDAWREALGVTSMSHEKRRDLTVKTLAAAHPVMTGFPAEWKNPQDELYKIEKQWPGMVPLAQAYGEETKKDHPVIWVNSYGKTRMFGTTLGHGNETMADPVYLDLVARGLLWAAGKLGDDGKPLAGFGPAAQAQ
jgi:type 1 glutamine amidotransferase